MGKIVEKKVVCCASVPPTLDDCVEKLVDNSQKHGFGPALLHFRHRKDYLPFAFEIVGAVLRYPDCL